MQPTKNIINHIERIKYNNHFVNLYQNSIIAMGFTETPCPGKQMEELAVTDLLKLFQGHCNETKELKQIHGNIVLHMDEIVGIDTRGDGIVLNRRGTLAVIKTADCTPLFCWNKLGTIGGVFHIGWQGLLKGMEKKALDKIADIQGSAEFNDFTFFMGPAIEQNCYEVGRDLYEKFATKSYGEQIFKPESRANEKAGEKYMMNIQEGIRLSLMESGIGEEQIISSGICTFCSPQYASYRRNPEKDDRIYNFLLLYPEIQ